MRNTILTTALLLMSIFAFAKESSSQYSRVQYSDDIPGSFQMNTSEGPKMMNKKLSTSNFCNCDNQYLQAMSVNQAMYDYERQECIAYFGNTVDGINCQTIALQNYSLNDQAIYSQWNECWRRCVIP